MPGVDFADPDSPADLDRLLDPARTAALIAEPIQGEGGIRARPSELLVRMREWTRERDIALILDEVQCGLGRTGTFLACEEAGILPDLLCLAKPLGGGLPMGAILLSEKIAAAIEAGDHGTTFGGGPLVSAVALAVVGVVGDAAFLVDVRRRGEQLGALLNGLARELGPVVREVRGRGLMWGIEIEEGAGAVVKRLRDLGLLTVSSRLQRGSTASPAHGERTRDRAGRWDPPNRSPSDVTGLWGGRFRGKLAPEMEALNRSLGTDGRLWREDVRGSRAWARGLLGAGVLTPDEHARLQVGLDQVEKALEGGIPADAPDEDVHSLVERLLGEAVGALSGKLHTGRSRNDQVATDPPPLGDGGRPLPREPSQRERASP